MWNNFIKPGLNIASPITLDGVVAKTKIARAGKVTSNILKSLTGGKFLSLRDMHGRGLRLTIM